MPATAGDGRDFFTAASKDGLVLGVGFGGFLLVLAREVLIHGAVEGTTKRFADTLDVC